MTEWYEGLSLARKFFVLIAIPATLVIFIQIFTFLAGAGRESSYSDGTRPPLFGVRVILSGLCAGGWTGFVLEGTSLPLWATVVIAAAVGIAAVALAAVISKKYRHH